jgi:hypothetical protein
MDAAVGKDQLQRRRTLARPLAPGHVAANEWGQVSEPV